MLLIIKGDSKGHEGIPTYTVEYGRAKNDFSYLMGWEL
jgi:hypothetical protein